MYNDLLIEQAVSDFLFYEPEENINAFKSYVESVNNHPEKISEILEDHIFSRLDIYLEDFSLILEDIGKPKDIQKHNAEAQRKIRELEIKGDLSSSDKKNLGSLRNIPQSGKADQYSKVEEVKKKKTTKKKSEKTEQQRKGTQEKWNKRGAKRDRKSLIRDIDKKLGRPTLRKAIADKAKKVWEKTKLRKVLRKAIETGVVAGKKIGQSTDAAKRKIESARKTFKKAASEFEALKAQQKKGTEHWKAIKNKEVEVAKARGMYRKLRMGKRYILRKKALRII
jgi:hypothetical protein